ncbi:hypothetical protein FB451DRAFT_1167621 [Mycena latifolia]|nr:hypothetical protein FB451DRAFT_1167621 [Mycena latifolia]
MAAHPRDVDARTNNDNIVLSCTPHAPRNTFEINEAEGEDVDGNACEDAEMRSDDESSESSDSEPEFESEEDMPLMYFTLSWKVHFRVRKADFQKLVQAITSTGIIIIPLPLRVVGHVSKGLFLARGSAKSTMYRTYCKACVSHQLDSVGVTTTGVVEGSQAFQDSGGGGLLQALAEAAEGSPG